MKGDDLRRLLLSWQLVMSAHGQEQNVVREDQESKKSAIPGEWRLGQEAGLSCHCLPGLSPVSSSLHVLVPAPS